MVVFTYLTGRSNHFEHMQGALQIQKMTVLTPGGCNIERIKTHNGEEKKDNCASKQSNHTANAHLTSLFCNVCNIYLAILFFSSLYYCIS